MKRFHLFAGNWYYPAARAGDYVASYDSLDAARAAIRIDRSNGFFPIKIVDPQPARWEDGEEWAVVMEARDDGLVKVAQTDPNTPYEWREVE